MARFIFTTDPGNSNFVNIIGVSNTHDRLHKTSRCIEWKYDETEDFFFDIDDSKYHVRDMSDIIIEGVTLANKEDFETNIILMFPGLVTGGITTPYANDIEISTEDKGLILKSTDGTRGRLIISKDGGGNLQPEIVPL